MKRVTLFLFLFVVACKHDEPKQNVATVASSAPPAASSAPSPPGPIVYKGSYTASAATLYVPDGGEWKGVKFRGDDAGVGLGEGTITLTIEPPGVVSGDLDGPLGAAHLTGLSVEQGFTFQVSPKDPTSDPAFSGTGFGSVEGKAVSGSIQLSSWRANVLREVSFKATAGASPPPPPPPR